MAIRSKCRYDLRMGSNALELIDHAIEDLTRLKAALASSSAHDDGTNERFWAEWSELSRKVSRAAMMAGSTISAVDAVREERAKRY